MALRIKCKCGRPLKVSSKLADKKLTCPACSRPFRIPLGKFKAAAAAAARRKAAGTQPVSQAAPQPVELDIHQPANLDIEPPPAAQVPMAQPAELDPLTTFEESRSSLLDDLAIEAEQTQTESAPPVAVPVASAPPATTAYAREKVKRKPHVSNIAGDAIEGPKRGFWADAFCAFVYPVWSFGNAMSFLAAAFLALLVLGLALIASILPCFVLPFIMIGFIFLLGWLARMYLSAVQGTASGSDDLPGISMSDGFLEDALKPLVKYYGAFAVAFAPTILLSLAVGLRWVPLSWAVIMPVWWIVGAFVAPMFLMLFSFGAISMVLRPDLVLLTIIRTIVPYLAMWLMLLLVAFAYLITMGAEVLALVGLQRLAPNMEALGLAGPIVAIVIDVYLTFVAMRLVGLYYLHFKKRFAIIME